MYIYIIIVCIAPKVHFFKSPLVKCDLAFHPEDDVFLVVVVCRRPANAWFCLLYYPHFLTFAFGDECVYEHRRRQRGNGTLSLVPRFFLSAETAGSCEHTRVVRPIQILGWKYGQYLCIVLDPVKPL